MNAVRNTLEAHVPGLHARIESMLAESEALFNQRAKQPASEFLLEHSRRTAAIAYKLAVMEEVDPFLPCVVALYHDAGKFHEGLYHDGDIPEEEHAAAIAEKMLGECGLSDDDIAQVQQGLRGLYNDALSCTDACKIVQDADRLDKLGGLGIAAFFTKAASRGRGLVAALTSSLSRELTYATAAPFTMMTASGRRMAVEQGAKTITFFDDLLRDLENLGIASFERRTIVLQEDFRARDGSPVPRLEVMIAMPRACPQCGAALTVAHSRGRGVKCEQLHVRFQCAACSHSLKTSFCLPIFARSRDERAELGRALARAR